MKNKNFIKIFNAMVKKEVDKEYNSIFSTLQNLEKEFGDKYYEAKKEIAIEVLEFVKNRLISNYILQKKINKSKILNEK